MQKAPQRLKKRFLPLGVYQHTSGALKTNSKGKERPSWAKRTLQAAIERTHNATVKKALLILDQAMDQIRSASLVDDAESEIQAGVEEIKGRAADRVPDNLVSWGVPFLNRRLGLIGRHELVVIGSRPSVGKSALLAQVALGMRATGRKISIFCLEMGRSELLERLAAISSGIPKTALGSLHPQRNASFEEAYLKIARDPGIRWHFKELSLSEIVGAASLDVKVHGVGAIFVDYIQLIEVPRAQRRLEAVTEVTRQLKLFAMSHQVPVLCASQLNRASDYDNRPPRLADLRESGSIEQEADRVLLIHRDEQVEYIIQAKNRAGPQAVVKVRFDAAITRFSEA